MIEFESGGVRHEQLINAIDKLQKDGTLLAGERLPVASCEK